MSTQIKTRRGTTTEHSTFVGSEAELTVDTTKDTVVVHDGSTAGGHPLAKTSGNTFTADQSHGSNVKAKFGTGDDLVIYHDGANSYIDEIGTGSLLIRGENVYLTDLAGKVYLGAVTDGAVSLRYNDSNKLATTSTGIDVTGNVSLADNGKATFGTGDDLQIYHSGADSYITDTGVGDLYIRASNEIRIQDGNQSNFLYAVEGGDIRLYHAGSQKLATTATGVDVTGTVVADGLASSAVITAQEGRSNTAGVGQLVIDPDDSSVSAAFRIDQTDNKLNIDMSGGGTWKKGLSLWANNDISFYEDQGITPKFFWDASAEKLAIGHSSPATTLHVNSASAATYPTLGTASGSLGLSVNSLHGMYLGVDGSSGNGWLQAMREDGTGTSYNLVLQPSGGNVGIGVVPDLELTVSGAMNLRNGSRAAAFEVTSGGDLYMGTATTAASIVFETGHTGTGLPSTGTERLRIGSTGILHVNGDATGGRISGDGSGGLNLQDGNGRQTFKIMSPASGSSQPMTLDALGNLLVGKTSQSFAAAGIEFRANGVANFIRSGATPVNVNRLADFGDLVIYHKDGIPVGSIGTNGGRLSIGSGDVNLNFNASANAIYPISDTAGTLSDGVVDLGAPSARLKDLHLFGGVVFGDAGGTGTSSSNTLDDYEEGYWTPTLTTNGTDFTSVTYDSGVNGTYTKVGRVVTLDGFMRTDAITKGSASDFVQVGGFPFSTVGSSIGNIGGTAGWLVNSPTNCQTSGAASMYLTYGANSTDFVVVADVATAANDNEVRFSITYITT